MNDQFSPPQYTNAVAAKLRERPEAIITETLRTLARWRAQGQTNPRRLDAWERLLREAAGGEAGKREALFHALESADPESVRLRDFHPFHGVLSREERRTLRSSCAFKH